MNSHLKNDLQKFLALDLSRVGDMHWVNVTHIINPQNFYVRLVSCTNYLIEMEENLKNNVRPDDTQIGDIITYNSTKSSSSVRGQIIYILDQEGTCSYDIFAVDYGYIDKDVKPEYVWACDTRYSQIPSLVMNCELEYCSPRGEEWSTESIEAFKYYIGTQIAHMTIMGMNDKKFIVQLDNTKNIAKIMAMTNYSQYFVSGFNKTTFISKMRHPAPTKLFYEQKVINVGDRLHIKVVNGKKLDWFYVAEKTDHDWYKKEKLQWSMCTASDKCFNDEDIKVDLPVLVKIYRNEYERGLVKQILTPNSKALVELVDLGKSIHAAFCNLKPMPFPDLYLSHPIAIECRAADPRAWCIGEYKLLMVGNEFMVTITKLKTESDPHNVDISPIENLTYC